MNGTQMTLIGQMTTDKSIADCGFVISDLFQPDNLDNPTTMTTLFYFGLRIFDCGFNDNE
jgi:hypothetical protein